MSNKRITFILAAAMALLFLGVAQVPADIVGLWQFEEGSGDVASDSSGFAHDGGLWAAPDGKVAGVTTPSSNPRWITGKNGSYALEFSSMPDGSLPDAQNTNWNYVYVAQTETLANLGLNWTIAVWIKQYVNDPSINIGGGGGYQRVISCPAYEVELGVPSWMYDYFWPHYTGGATGAFCQAIGATQAVGSWYHMAITYDGATLKKYVNGSLQSSVPVASELLPDTFDTWEYLRFGRQTDYEKDYFIGALDDVAIFNETLDSTQIATIMTGDFSGPWKEVVMTYEDDNPIDFVYDPSFIGTKGSFPLDFGETEPNMPGWWNWDMEGTLDNGDWHGIVNAGLWDGDNTSIEYAGFCTVGDQITQTVIRRTINEGIGYRFVARVGGVDAIGNIIGVKYYAVDESENLTLLQDLNTTITANETWNDLEWSYTPSAAHDGQSFKLVCYVEQNIGNGRGTAFAYFDFARINAESFADCDAWKDYNDGYSGLTNDFNQDCIVNLPDYQTVGQDWGMSNSPEPMSASGQLLTNPDFYADIDLVPNYNDSDNSAPTGWQYISTGGTAGIWNLSESGKAHTYGTQPAGGSVAVFLEPNDVLTQTVSSGAVVSGQTYYLSAMVAGTAEAYLNIVTVTLERVNTPVNPTSVVEISSQQFVIPKNTIWRRLTTEYTADASAAGQYLRVNCTFGTTEFSGDSGLGLIGHASLTTVEPADWPRDNLLSNGDFEDISSLALEDYLNLHTDDGYTSFVSSSDYPVGWKFASMGTNEYAGFQCMLWAPSPQPAQGRVSVWFGNSTVTSGPRLEQKVTTESIQNGQTYYLDMIGAISAANFNSGEWTWPDPAPQIVAELYWVEPGATDLSGNHGLIATASATSDGSLGAMGGHWQMPQASFTAGPSIAGKSFYISIYGEAPYTTIEQVTLSKTAPPVIGPYNCYDSVINYGLGSEADLNDDCKVDITDLRLFADTWLTQVGL